MRERIVIIFNSCKHNSFLINALKNLENSFGKEENVAFLFPENIFHRKYHLISKNVDIFDVSKIEDDDCVFVHEPWISLNDGKVIRELCNILKNSDSEFIRLSPDLHKFFDLLPHPQFLLNSVSLKDFLYILFVPNPALHHIYSKIVMRGALFRRALSKLKHDLIRYIGDLWVPVVAVNDLWIPSLDVLLPINERWILDNIREIKQRFLNTTSVVLQRFLKEWHKQLPENEIYSVFKKVFYLFEAELWDGSVVKRNSLDNFEYYRVNYTPLLKVIRDTDNYFWNDKLEKLSDWIDNLYEKHNKPLVSILIPVYNQLKLFKLAFQSAIDQTYPNIEVLVGDDSTNYDVKKYMESIVNNHKNIKYFFHEGKGPVENEFGALNKSFLFKTAKGHYISFLSHDDIIHPEKIRIMVNFLYLEDDATLVTSYRKCIDTFSKPVKNCSLAYKRITNNILIYEGDEAARKMLLSTLNYIGEPSVAMFRKKDSNSDFGDFEGFKARINDDQAQWLKLLKKGYMIYLPIPLTFVRIHSEQLQRNPTSIYLAYRELVELVNKSLGLYLNSRESKVILMNCLKSFFLSVKPLIMSEIDQEEIKKFTNKVLRLIRNM